MAWSVRPLLRFVALVWLAMAMTVPATAWTMHKASHGAVQVDADAHHHHDDAGHVTLDVHDRDDRSGDMPRGGHDHMATVHFGAMTVPDVAVSLAAPVAVRTGFASAPVPGTEWHRSDGLRRPPRLG